MFFFNDADLRTDDFYLRYMIIVQGKYKRIGVSLQFCTKVY